MSDDSHRKLPTKERVANKDDEEPETILAYVNRKLKASSAERLAAYDEIGRKARKWDLEGRDLERRRVEALEALAEREREGSQTDLDEQLSFTKDDLEVYVEQRKSGLAVKSLDWVQRSSKAIWESTKGEISPHTMKVLRESVLEKYKSPYSHTKVMSFAKAFLQFLTLTKQEPRYTSFAIYLELPRAVKERKSMTEIVSKEDIQNVLGYIKRAEQHGEISKQRAEQYTAFVIFGAFSGQRSESTIAKLTVGQFREALKMEKPAIMVKSSQDKVRMSHWIPIHPQALEAVKPLLEGKDDDEPMFVHESFKMWVKREKIPMSRFNKNFFLGALRKWAEQQGDIIQWNDSNRAYILTHGVGGIAWKHYKAFQKDSVYDVYMSAWRDVELG